MEWDALSLGLPELASRGSQPAGSRCSGRQLPAGVSWPWAVHTGDGECGPALLGLTLKLEQAPTVTTVQS